MSRSTSGSDSRSSGVMLPKRSTVPISAASSLSMISAVRPCSIKTLTGAPGTIIVDICDSTSWRFSSSLLISTFQPINFAASRTFCPFLPIARDNCVSSTITSICRSIMSRIVTRLILAGLKACVAKPIGSSEYSIISIFSPRNSRIID